MKSTFIALLLFLIAAPSFAAPLLHIVPYQAIVISVHDGDTLTVLHAGHREKVRLAHCDAPELAAPHKCSGQPRAWDATAALIQLVMGQRVTVIPTGQLSYRRTVADIHIAAIDVCHEMARAGATWIDPRWDGNDMSLYAAQDEAAKAHRGLWRDPDPIPPWLWRAARK